MEYLIVPNFYAPKSPHYIEKHGSDRIHAVSFNKCNFRCSFCGFSHLVQENSYFDYNLEQFEAKIKRFIELGPGFKFTGGEPTLNPELLLCMETVKKRGGCVLLDTNGSRVDTVRSAVENSLVDVLGISLKGVTPEEAVKTSGVNNATLCWDNVLDSIACGAERDAVDVIVTYVVTSKTDLKALETFTALFSGSSNVYLKINNFQRSKYTRDVDLAPYAIDSLREALQQLVQRNPQMRGKLIFVGSPMGISNSEGIEVF